MKKEKCNLCGNDNCNYILTAPDRQYKNKILTKYYHCKNCDVFFQEKNELSPNIKNFYNNDYKPHKIKSGKVQKLINKFKNIFPQTTKLDRKAKKTIKNAKSIIDIGCGNGDFIYKIQQNYPQKMYYALDISPNAFNKIRDIKGINKIVSAFTKFNTTKKFDVITLWWYLEHSITPEEDLIRINKIISDNGLLIIGVPNHKSIARYLFKSFWYNLDAPRHINIFSPKSIRKFLYKNNFLIENITFAKSTLGLVGSIKQLLNLNNKLLIILLEVIFFPISIIISWLKISDLIIIYARKNK